MECKGILIKNGNIITATSNTIEKGDILIKNGKIADIAKNINVQCEEEINAEGCTVIPGLIESHCHLGIIEDSIGEAGDDSNESTDPLTPHLRAIDGVNPLDRYFNDALSGGVTVVSTGPGSSNILAGSFTTMKTYGYRVDDMALKKVSAIKASFGENPKSVFGGKGLSPKTRMATAAMLREILYKTKEYMNIKEKCKKGDEPPYNIKYESLIPLLKREIPLKVHVHRTDDIFTAIRIIKEFDLKATLDHCTEGDLIVNELREEGFKIIVGPGLTDRSKMEVSRLSFSLAKTLNENGILIAITTDHPEVPINRLNVCAALCVKEGLDYYDAIKAITINPAKILEIDKKVGSIEIGKHGDIVIFDGDPLDIRSNVKYTIIEGKIVYSSCK